MDGNRFDSIARRFARGEIGRRELVIGALGIAVGAPGAARLAMAQDADPTSEVRAPDGTGGTAQQFPCPPGPTGPFNPNDWICGTGPFGPWYPVVAPPEITAATGIRWYGFQGLETGGIGAEAFARTGESVSHCSWEPTDGVARWVMGSADAEIAASVNPPRVDGTQVEISGEINGMPFRSVVTQDGVVEPDQSIVLDADQQRLLEQWQPAVERAGGLLQLSLTSGHDPFAASGTGCFIAGFLAVPTTVLCIVSAGGCVIPAAVVGTYINDNCTDSW